MMHPTHGRYTVRLVSMRRQEKGGQDWRGILVTTLIALATAVLVRSFVVESCSGDGYSMEPTLGTGDRVLVNKRAFLRGKPRTGEIMVFHRPEIDNQDGIKRVIGVPGDTVRIQHNVVRHQWAPLSGAVPRVSPFPHRAPDQDPGRHRFRAGRQSARQ
jgi:signal peptidase I